MAGKERGYYLALVTNSVFLKRQSGRKCRPMSTDRAGAVTEVWGREAQSPAQITHEKADGVLEKSLSNVHTLTIRRCGPLFQRRHCQLHAGWVTESLK